MTYYYSVYENFIADFSRKADLVKKLGLVTFYEDKVRIHYDDDLKKL